MRFFFNFHLILLLYTHLLSAESFWDRHIKSFIDHSQERISNQVSERALWFDQFFGNEKSEENGSVIRLSLGPEWSNEDKFRLRMRLKGKMDLPNFKRRFKIIFISDTEQHFDESMDGSINHSENVDRRNNNKNFFASALRWSIDLQREHKIDLDAGIKFKFPLSPFARAQYTKKYKLNDDWQLQFSQTIFAVLNDESGETTRFDFDRRLAKKLFFRFSNWATWSDESQGVDLFQSASLYQNICVKSALHYALSWKSITDPKLMSDTYTAQLQYRQNIYRPWFYFILEPAVSYAREDDWHPETRIRFMMQFYFGHKQKTSKQLHKL